MARRCLILLALATMVACKANDDQSLETPRQLLAVFYTCLLSGAPIEELPPILSHTTTLASALPGAPQRVFNDERLATVEVWKYLRAITNHFLFPDIAPLETVRRARLVYVFTTFANAATFFDGMFCVELMAPVSLRGREGVTKQVRFRLEKNNRATGPPYAVDVSGIGINGVLLDPAMEYDRSRDLYELLGIKPERKPNADAKAAGP
jgi:hypothetical protein